MTRRIITKQPEAVAGEEIDTYFDRVVKYIPADIVAAWTAAAGLVASAGPRVNAKMLLWVVFVFELILTPLWILKQTSRPNKPPAAAQSIIGTGAFFVWVFALGGPFVYLSFYQPIYGSLLLIFYTLIVALKVPKA
jgi:hypothetical protein